MQSASLGWSRVTQKLPLVQPRCARSPQSVANTCGSGGAPSATVTTGISSSVLMSATAERAGSDRLESSAEELKLSPMRDAKSAVAVVPGRMRVGEIRPGQSHDAAAAEV